MSMLTLRYVYVNLMLCQSTLISVNQPKIKLINLIQCRSIGGMSPTASTM